MEQSTSRFQLKTDVILQETKGQSVVRVTSNKRKNPYFNFYSRFVGKFLCPDKRILFLKRRKWMLRARAATVANFQQFFMPSGAYRMALLYKQYLKRAFGIREYYLQQHMLLHKLNLQNRFDVLCVKARFCETLGIARQWIKQGFFSINGKISTTPLQYLKPNDFVQFNLLKFYTLMPALTSKFYGTVSTRAVNYLLLIVRFPLVIMRAVQTAIMSRSLCVLQNVSIIKYFFLVMYVSSVLKISKNTLLIYLFKSFQYSFTKIDLKIFFKYFLFFELFQKKISTKQNGALGQQKCVYSCFVKQSQTCFYFMKASWLGCFAKIRNIIFTTTTTPFPLGWIYRYFIFCILNQNFIKYHKDELVSFRRGLLFMGAKFRGTFLHRFWRSNTYTLYWNLWSTYSQINRDSLGCIVQFERLLFIVWYNLLFKYIKFRECFRALVINVKLNARKMKRRQFFIRRKSRHLNFYVKNFRFFWFLKRIFWWHKRTTTHMRQTYPVFFFRIRPRNFKQCLSARFSIINVRLQNKGLVKNLKFVVRPVTRFYSVSFKGLVKQPERNLIQQSNNKKELKVRYPTNEQQQLQHYKLAPYALQTWKVYTRKHAERARHFGLVKGVQQVEDATITANFVAGKGSYHGRLFKTMKFLSKNQFCSRNVGCVFHLKRKGKRVKACFISAAILSNIQYMFFIIFYLRILLLGKNIYANRFIFFKLINLFAHVARMSWFLQAPFFKTKLLNWVLALTCAVSTSNFFVVSSYKINKVNNSVMTKIFMQENARRFQTLKLSHSYLFKKKFMAPWFHRQKYANTEFVRSKYFSLTHVFLLRKLYMFTHRIRPNAKFKHTTNAFAYAQRYRLRAMSARSYQDYSIEVDFNQVGFIVLENSANFIYKGLINRNYLIMLLMRANIHRQLSY